MSTNTSADRPYWNKQTVAEPLFPDIAWSRPENRRQAGKLLIVGGSAQGFAAAAAAFASAEKAGIGTARVLLPDRLQKTVGRMFVGGEYAPSTPVGSFSKKALAELLELSEWSDCVLLAGDFGRNSETAVMLEQAAAKYKGPLVITKDAMDYFVKTPLSILGRKKTLLVISFAQLQKLAVNAPYDKAFTFDMDLLRLVDTLHDFTQKHSAYVVVKQLENIFVAVNGEVSTTKLEKDLPVWRVNTAANAAVWWLQNPSKPFESITASLIK